MMSDQNKKHERFDGLVFIVLSFGKIVLNLNNLHLKVFHFNFFLNNMILIKYKYL